MRCNGRCFVVGSLAKLRFRLRSLRIATAISLLVEIGEEYFKKLQGTTYVTDRVLSSGVSTLSCKSSSSSSKSGSHSSADESLTLRLYFVGVKP